MQQGVTLRRVPWLSSLRISVAVRHHPSREKLLPDLLERLPGASVPMDEDLSRWGSGRRALLAFDPTATHHLVVEDDAIVPHHLIRTLHGAIRYAPAASPLSLYLPEAGPDDPYLQSAYKGADQGTSWIITGAPMSGVAVVFPVAHLRELVAFGDADEEPTYDGKIARFYTSKGIRCWNSWPSLVDHNPGVASITPGKQTGRIAAHFIGVDARAFDPTKLATDAG